MLPLQHPSPHGCPRHHRGFATEDLKVNTPFSTAKKSTGFLAHENPYASGDSRARNTTSQSLARLQKHMDSRQFPYPPRPPTPGPGPRGPGPLGPPRPPVPTPPPSPRRSDHVDSMGAEQSQAIKLYMSMWIAVDGIKSYFLRGSYDNSSESMYPLPNHGSMPLYL